MQVKQATLADDWNGAQHKQLAQHMILLAITSNQALRADVAEIGA
jgi:hypothetical protein